MMMWSWTVMPSGLAHIGSGGRWIARRVVMREDQGGSAEFERALDHLARIDRGVVDGAALLHFVGDQPVFLVEEQYAELLDVLERHGRAAVIDQGRP